MGIFLAGGNLRATIESAEDGLGYISKGDKKRAVKPPASLSAALDSSTEYIASRLNKNKNKLGGLFIYSSFLAGAIAS
jgi:hypothetical protein